MAKLTDVVLVTSDIGTSVQAYDANLQSFVTLFTLPTSDGTNGQVLTTDGSGAISFTTPAAGGGGFEQTFMLMGA